MAISYVDSTITTAQNVATQTGTAPTGVASGDFLIIATSASLATLPVWAAASYTGWTIAEDQTETAMITRILYRIADGTGTDTPPAIATNAAAHRVTVVAAYRGVDATTPFIAEAGQVAASTQTVHAAPSITNTDANAWGVYSGHARQVATPLTWTPGTGLTERKDADTALANTNNTAGTWCDTNGVVATGAVVYSATTSATTPQSVAWAAFLRPGASDISVSIPSAGVGAAAGTSAPTVAPDVPSASTPARGADVAVTADSTQAVPSASVAAAAGTAEPGSAISVPSAAAGVSGGTATVTADASPGVDSASLAARGSYIEPGTAADTPSAGVGFSAGPATPTVAADVPSASVGARGTGLSPAIAVNVPSASVAIRSGTVFPAQLHPYQWWDGALWQPIFPLVWDGGTWRQDVPVVVIPPDE